MQKNKIFKKKNFYNKNINKNIEKNSSYFNKNSQLKNKKRFNKFNKNSQLKNKKRFNKFNKVIRITLLKKKKPKTTNYLHSNKKLKQGIFLKKPSFNEIIYPFPLNITLINEYLKKK